MWVFRLVSVLLVLLVSGCALTSSPPVDYQAVMAEKGAEAAFPALKKAADSGDTKAMMMLADLYQSDWTGETNKSKAMRYYRLARDASQEKAAGHWQALYEAGVREDRHAQADKNTREAPIFEWKAPEKSVKSGRDISDEYFAVSSGTSELDLQQEKHYFMPWGKTRSSRLYRTANAAGIDHNPDSGYSKWVLPNFLMQVSEAADSTPWRRIQFTYSLEPGKKLAEFKLPFELRTNLSPANKISVLLYHTGEVAVKTATSPGKSFLHYESPAIVDGKQPIDLEFWNNLDGDWRLTINGSLAGTGRVAPEKVTNGLSNHFFIEGDINIDSLIMSEGLHSDKQRVPVLWENSVEKLENAAIDRFMPDWLKVYLGEDNVDGWEYVEHERIYLRRSPFDWRNIVHDAVRHGPDSENPVAFDRMRTTYQSLPEMAAPKTSYLASMLVTVRNRDGDVLRFPAQFLLGVVDEKAELLSVKILFNAIDNSGDDFYFGNRIDMEKGHFQSLFGTDT